jgi:hypothetical protein
VAETSGRAWLVAHLVIAGVDPVIQGLLNARLEAEHDIVREQIKRGDHYGEQVSSTALRMSPASAEPYAGRDDGHRGRPEQFATALAHA